MGWANASLRYPQELPELSAPGKGVVREDPIEAGFSPTASLSPRNAIPVPQNRGGFRATVSAALQGLGLDKGIGLNPMERLARFGLGTGAMDVVMGSSPQRQPSPELRAAQEEISKEPQAVVRLDPEV